MPSLRCEALNYNQTVVADLGAANTTTSPTTPSAVIYGPVKDSTDVLVTSFGWSGYVTKGGRTLPPAVVPVATDANSKAMKDGDILPLRLNAGESIAAIAASFT